jgi:hypothetical protein
MGPMTPEDVSHREIYVRLAELGAKIDSILAIMAERKEDMVRINGDLNGLLVRQRAIESRMAQVVILGSVLALLLPIVGSWITLRLVIPVAIEQREVKP